MVFFIIAILIILGVAGIIIRNIGVRFLLWIVSIIPFGFGALALLQGGIAKPFSIKTMVVFCSIAFWPVVGCILGEILRKRKLAQQ